MEKLVVIELGASEITFSKLSFTSNGYFSLEQQIKEPVRLTQDLERDGYIVLEIKESSNSDFIYSDYEYNIPFSSKMVLSVREKKEFFNSFYFLYKSGYSILQIFDSMYNSSKNQKIKSFTLRFRRPTA